MTETSFSSSGGNIEFSIRKTVDVYAKIINILENSFMAFISV